MQSEDEPHWIPDPAKGGSKLWFVTVTRVQILVISEHSFSKLMYSAVKYMGRPRPLPNTLCHGLFGFLRAYALNPLSHVWTEWYMLASNGSLRLVSL